MLIFPAEVCFTDLGARIVIAYLIADYILQKMLTMPSADLLLDANDANAVLGAAGRH